MRYLYLDIETIPAQRPDVLQEIRSDLNSKLTADVAALKPPGNIKKQESIDAWKTIELPKAVEGLFDQFGVDVNTAYRKTGLDGAFGQICVIGFAIDDELPQTVWQGDWMQQGTEHEVLEHFACALTDWIPHNAERSMCVVGHNVASFDLRFLVQRSIVNHVRPHRVIAAAAQAKPWESEKVFDTMIQWAGVGNRIKLDKLCKALSIPTPKTDITGAAVWDVVQAGRIAEVAEYCARDVIATRAVHRRLTFQDAPVMAVDFEDVAA